MKTTSHILAGLLFSWTFQSSAIAQTEGIPGELQQYHAVARPSPALSEAMSLVDRAWQAGPLGFTEAVFVERASTAYGTYAVRTSVRFAVGETLRVYAEPVGFGYGREGTLYLIGLTTDIEVRIPSGQVIVSQRDFARIGARAGKPITEFSANLALSFDGLKPGSYILKITFRDLNSSKSADISLPFIVEAQQ